VSATWIVVPCLLALRDEFNTLAPNRDRGADGTIGDPRHQEESSDHNPDETGNTPFEDADNVNEVHALDVDSTGPWPAGKDLDSRVEIIRLRHQRGLDDRLQNIIWRGRVASRSWGWEWRTRDGVGHFDHAHFSARYTTAQENDMRPWGVIEEDDVSAADVWNAEIGKAPNRITMAQAVADARSAAMAAQAGITALAAAFAAQDHVDEVALGKSVAAALAPTIISALPPGTLTEVQIEEAVRNVLRSGVGTV
jgi:hypothetical protein